MNGPDITFFMDNRLYNAGDIKKWLDNEKDVEVASDMIPCTEAKGPSVNGNKLVTSLLVCEMTGSMDKIDSIEVVEGDKKDAPGDGEVWIPTGFAYENGIGPGDVITMATASGVSGLKVTIGILKTTGFTPGNIISAYILQVLLICVVSIPVGIFASFFVISRLTVSLLKVLNIADTDLPFLLIFAGVFAVMTAILGLFTFISAWKAGRVKASDAIRYGEPAGKLRKGGTPAKLAASLAIPAALGINQMVTAKRQNVYNFVVFLAAAFVITFSINTYDSLSHMTKDRTFFGFDSSDISVISQGKDFGVPCDELASWLRSDQRVRLVVPSSYISTGVVPENSENPAKSLVGVCYDGDMSALGILNMDGRNPVNSDEIAIASKTSEKYGKKVGDVFNIYIEGRLLKLKVSGIYQTFSNNGQGYRISYDAMKKANPDYELTEMLVKLNDGVDVRNFAADVEGSHGGLLSTVIAEDKFVDKTKPQTGGMSIVLIFVSTVFILLLTATLASSTILFIHKNKKIYGIYKTIGLTPGQIRLSIVSKNLVIALPGMTAGILLSLYALAPALTSICGRMGIVRYPFTANLWRTSIILPFILGICFLSSWISSGRVLKINSRILLNEE